MSFDYWVIDASMGCRNGMFCFCPVDGDLQGDFQIVTGMNYISDNGPPNGIAVAVVHPDGQDAVERFCAEHKDALTRVFPKSE